MKISVAFIFIFLIGLLSCKDEVTVTNDNSKSPVGSWEWVEACKGNPPVCTFPDSATAKTITFAADGFTGTVADSTYIMIFYKLENKMIFPDFTTYQVILGHGGPWQLTISESAMNLQDGAVTETYKLKR